MTPIEKAFRLFVLVPITLTLTPLSTSAQGPANSRLAAGVAAGLAVPIHADYDFNAPEWQVSIRAAVSDHVVLEGFFDEWRKSTEDVLQSVPLRDPDGIIGHVDRVSLRTRYSTRVVGVNGLLRGHFGRVSVSGGGGPGLLFYRRDFAQVLSGCQSSVPRVCDNSGNRWTSSSFTVQAVAAIDVAIASRLSGFVQGQMIAPINDFGSMHVGLVGGVRFGVW